MSKTIEELGDYPALRQVADALWAEGAAALIGAGFSRNAVLTAPDAPSPPLWDGLARRMGQRLYHEDPSSAPRDPLRLAEEYRTFFGQAALNEFIRTHIRDDAWTPGLLHKLFLELPWADVLTTNYDTLLERAAGEVNSPSYEAVRLEADLAHARAPRIVKLHGSIGATESFIIAEDDYRTYPSNHAAFVNFARQTFLENELCLFGFSGDDANFLQWAGWVRDHLGASARRIYLIGVLDLSPAKRRYLDARNIAPIDLAPLVATVDSELRHQRASTLVLEFLGNAKPAERHTWSITEALDRPFSGDDFTRLHQDVGFAAALLEETLIVWITDREAYPGWAICPLTLRQQLDSSPHQTPALNQHTLSGLATPTRDALLYEYVWRKSRILWIVDAHLAPLLEVLADPAAPCSLSSAKQLEIACALLVTARLTKNSASFDRWFAVITGHAAAGSDAAAEAHYQKALLSRDRLDLAQLELLAPMVIGEDPMWSLRRAALLCDVEAYEEAESAVHSALSDLEHRQRRDRQSIWIMSRRAWAEWFASIFVRARLQPHRALDREFAYNECNPWDLLDAQKMNLSEALTKKREEDVRFRPKFEPGRYDDSATTIRLGAPREIASFSFRLFIERAGIPVRVGRVSVAAASLVEVFSLFPEPDYDDWLELIRIVGGAGDGDFERLFSRLHLAQQPADRRAALTDQLREVVTFFCNRLARRHDFWRVDLLSNRLDVLARLAALEIDSSAKRIFLFARDCLNDSSLRHPFILKSLGTLLTYTFLAVQPQNRSDLVLALIELPLAGEIGLPPHADWPVVSELIHKGQVRRQMNDLRWKARIGVLVEKACVGSPDRGEALLRLVYLFQSKALRPAEARAFAIALWSACDGGSDALPTANTLLASAYVWLPQPEGVDAEERLRRRYFRGDGLKDETALAVLISLARPGRGIAAIRPTPDEAARLFDRLAGWRPPVREEGFAGAMQGSRDGRVAQLVGEALSFSLAPALSPASRDAARLGALLAHLEASKSFTALGALPFFRQVDLESAATARTRVASALNGITFEEVYGGVIAIDQWRNSCVEFGGSVDSVVLDRLIRVIEFGRWPGLHLLLNAAERFVQEGGLSPQQIKRLEMALSDLILQTDYGSIDPLSLSAVNVSLVRQNCIRLADALVKAGHGGDVSRNWVEIGSLDPLPEVRYAILEE